MAQVNSMCRDCTKYGKGCNGTTEQHWTGCVEKRTESEKLTKYFVDYCLIGSVIHEWQTLKEEIYGRSILDVFQIVPNLLSEQIKDTKATELKLRIFDENMNLIAIG